MGEKGKTALLEAGRKEKKEGRSGPNEKVKSLACCVLQRRQPEGEKKGRMCLCPSVAGRGGGRRNQWSGPLFLRWSAFLRRSKVLSTNVGGRKKERKGPRYYGPLLGLREKKRRLGTPITIGLPSPEKKIRPVKKRRKTKIRLLCGGG